MLSSINIIDLKNKLIENFHLSLKFCSKLNNLYYLLSIFLSAMEESEKN